jgi:glycerol-3-phosphate dehydrogenase
LFLDARAAAAAAPVVANILARELHKDECWQEQQVQEFTCLAARYTLTG